MEPNGYTVVNGNIILHVIFSTKPIIIDKQNVSVVLSKANEKH